MERESNEREVRKEGSDKNQKSSVELRSFCVDCDKSEQRVERFRNYG